MKLMAINDQMEMAFSGPALRVDPVSGNEVPPGSLPEEVRDDIDVNLSTGEYVVPADVLRFHGVKFFEDLRTEAKMGLAGMDAAGRIGGEPVEGAPMDPAAMGISEEDIAMLEQALAGEGVPEAAMAEGGLMDKVAFAAMNDPLVNERINSKGMAVGFAAGGMTQSLYNDPTKIDSLIDQVMTAAQTNPSLLEQLSKRGISINTTQADMQPTEMKQANTQPVELAHGGLTHSGGAPGTTGATPLGFTGDMGTAPTVPTKAEGGTGFNPFQYGLGFSSFGLTNPAGSVPTPVAPAPVGGFTAPAPVAPARLTTGRNSVAVGESYIHPGTGETRTRMPDAYYAGGGDADQKRALKKLGEESDKWSEKYSYGDSDKLFSETMAAATGENNPLEKVIYGLGRSSLFAAGEYVNLSDNIAALKRRGYDEGELAKLTTAVEAKKTAELGANPKFLARRVLALGKSMAETQAKRIDDLFPIADAGSSSSSTSTVTPNLPADTPTSSSVINRPSSLKGDPSKSIFKKSAAEKAEIQKATMQSIKTNKNYGKDPSKVSGTAKPIKVTKSKDTSFVGKTGKEQKEREGDGSFGALNKGGLMQKKK
jgi:hypothetical protein